MSEWIPHLIAQLGYVGVALLMFAETVFPPIPSEVIMPLAGMEAGRGTMSLPGVILAGGIGAMSGNALWFAAARALGVDRFRGFVARHGRWLTLEWQDVERARALLAKAGGWFVCLGRLVPTIRSVVSIPAGLLRMRWVPFLLWSSVGTFAWTALLAGAGALLRQHFSAVNGFVGPISTGVLVVLLVAYVWRVLRWPRRRHNDR